MKGILGIVLFLLTLCFGTASAFSADLKTISSEAEKGDSIVRSGYGQIVYTMTRVDSLSARTKQKDQELTSSLLPGQTMIIQNYTEVFIDMSFDGPRIRNDISTIFNCPDGTSFSSHWLSSYDGNQTEELHLDSLGPNGFITPRGYVRTENVIRVHQYDPRYYGNAVFNVPVATFVGGLCREGSLENIRISGEETIDGIVCDIVEADVAKSDKAYKVWLAAEYNYRPVKYELRTSEGLEEVINSFKQYGDVWFPEMITVQKYYFDGKQFVIEKRMTLDVDDRFEVNSVLEREVFDIDFPRGLSVYDFRTGENYIKE